MGSLAAPETKASVEDTDRRERVVAMKAACMMLGVRVKSAAISRCDVLAVVCAVACCLSQQRCVHLICIVLSTLVLKAGSVS